MTRRGLLAGAAMAAPTMAAQAGRYDIFLLAGQSNMAGRGAVEAEDKKPIPRVLALNKEMEWKPAVDPLHWDKPEIVGVGMGRSFARVLAAQNPKATIGLVPVAMGGSYLDEWKPGGKLFTNAVTRGRHAAQSGVLRGILWHQGEAEAKDVDKAQTYLERWIPFMEAFRKELGAPELPVVLGQLGEFLDMARSPYAGVVNQQLAILPLKAPRTIFVPSAGLKHKGDVVHFDSPSLREFGRRYAMGYLSLDASWGA